MGPIIGHYRCIELKHKISDRLAEQNFIEQISQVIFIVQYPFPVCHNVQWCPQEAYDAEWDALHEGYAEQTYACLCDLKGFYTKVGQILASRTDIMPSVYIERLRQLEDAVPPQPLAVVSQTICSDFGVDDLFELFAEFEKDPLGSASIGQCHRAILKDGSEVAVKVQYPDAERLFHSDIKTARLFCAVAVPEQLVVFNEIERQFKNEFDYREVRV
jgi:aarF domain-containing kinase